jgi:hypothetical protein
MSTTLSKCSRPSMRSWARARRGVVQAARGGLVEGLDGEGALAAAGDAGDAGQHAHGDLARDALEVVAGGAGDLEPLLAERAAAVGHGDLARADQVLAGQALGIGHDLGGLALGHDLAAVDAGGRPHVDDVVGGEDGLLVVLDDQDGVAEVAEAAEALQQAGVVALVQADAGLVQDVEHAGEARADLAGQADALALAAGERAGAARQRQVVQAHVVQEAEAVADLLEDASAISACWA